MRIYITTLLSIVFFINAHSQCVGLEIIGFNSVNPDQLLIRVTEDLPGNTTFYITDNEWDGTSFNGGENTDTWTTPALGILAGSTILISDLGVTCGNSTGVPFFSTGGEEIYITSITPSSISNKSDICFGVIFGGTGMLPDNGVDLGTIDNAFFNSGDIQVASNWTTSNSIITLPSGSCNTTVPVKYSNISLSNTPTHNLLTWSTASEVNNDYFQVEHSLEGAYFTALGRVTGRNNLRANVDYEYRHDNPALGKHYYRLRQVDYDGTESLSEIFSTEVLRNGDAILFPSAASNLITVRHQMGQNVTGSIVDAAGRTLARHDLVPDNTQLEIGDITKGMYFLILVNEVSSKTLRFMKK